MSKFFKCPNCKDVHNKEDDIISVRCDCGEYMEHVDENHNPIIELTIALNKVDLDVLNSATQANVETPTPLKALCGDIIIAEYQKQVRDIKRITKHLKSK